MPLELDDRLAAIGFVAALEDIYPSLLKDDPIMRLAKWNQDPEQIMSFLHQAVRVNETVGELIGQFGGDDMRYLYVSALERSSWDGATSWRCVRRRGSLDGGCARADPHHALARLRARLGGGEQPRAVPAEDPLGSAPRALLLPDHDRPRSPASREHWAAPDQPARHDGPLRRHPLRTAYRDRRALEASHG